MRKAVQELGQTIVMVTHDATAAAYASRVIFLAGRSHRRRDLRAHLAVDSREDAPAGRLTHHVESHAQGSRRTQSPLSPHRARVIISVAFISGTQC